MPSRVIISSVKQEHADERRAAGLQRRGSRWPSISLLIRLPARHMCTVSEATESAATSASTPSQSAWLVAARSRTPAPMLSDHRERDAPVDRGNQRAAPGLLEVGQADGDDQEGFEPFAEGDDERLKHGSRTGPELRLISILSLSRDIRPVKSGFGLPTPTVVSA